MNKILSVLPEADQDVGPFISSLLATPMSNGEKPYDEIFDLSSLKTFLEEQLENYNLEPGLVQMDLVMFRDAMLHLLRIHRTLSYPRGNLTLIGVGGSGRQSLTRLASFLSEYQVFQIELTKNYRSTEFHEDLKLLYRVSNQKQY